MFSLSDSNFSMCAISEFVTTSFAELTLKKSKGANVEHTPNTSKVMSDREERGNHSVSTLVHQTGHVLLDLYT